MRAWKFLACGVLAGLTATVGTAMNAPARAETINLVCSRTPADQASLRQMGYSSTADTVMHVSIDTAAQTAADTATYPGDTNPQAPVTYSATITSDLVTWSTPPDEDGDKATRYFNRSTNVLNTVDPGGSSTLWNCS
jgi:hypothetical protein